MPLYDFHGVDPRANDPLHPVNVAGHVAAALWILAYVLMMVRGQRDRAPGLPLVAICLNFGWEILASFVFPASSPMWKLMYRAWLAGDVFIVVQLLRYGRDVQASPLVRRFFHPIVAVVFALGLLGLYTFVATFRDRQGIVAAYMINLIMSVLFVPMYLARRAHRRGISVGAAWAKLAGTAIQAVQCYFLVPWLDPERRDVSFLVFLAGACFAFDLLYALLASTKVFDGVLDEPPRPSPRG